MDLLAYAEDGEVKMILCVAKAERTLASLGTQKVAVYFVSELDW